MLTIKIQNEAGGEVSNLNKAQMSAVRKMERLLRDRYTHPAIARDYVLTLTVLDGAVTRYSCEWLRVEIEMPGPSEGNFLRFLEEQDDWFIQLGKRGAMTARRYPNSMKQFEGKSWCGINIRKA